MKLDKLVKKLQNEVKKNPAKAGVLALLLLVALWFWAPLVMKWCGSGSGNVAEITSDAGTTSPTAATTSAEPTTTANVNATDASAGPGAADAGGKAKTMQASWRDIVKWIETDPRMTPVELTAGARDPLHEIPKLKVETPKPKPVIIVKEVLPDELNFRLSSTMVGVRRKLARIDGKSYTEGDALTSESRSDIEFVIEEIKPRSVTLGRLGHHYELKLATPEFSNSASTGAAASPSVSLPPPPKLSVP